MSRISQRLADLRKRDELGLVAYITAGDPNLQATAEYIAALESAGTDLIELGIPFSDPLADGPVIQRASERALAVGTNLARILDLVAKVRQSSQLPLVLFGYLNPFLRYGFEKFARDARQAGADGVLITDLSVEEAAPYLEPVRAAELDTIFLAAPTSTDARLRAIARVSSGFVYAVSRMGVTGTRDSLSDQLVPLLARIRKVTELPLAVGFGVSRREHVSALRGHADAAVVGSALVRVIEETRSAEALAALARDLKQGAAEFARVNHGHQ